MKPITPSTIAVLSSGGVDSNVLVGEYAHHGMRVYPIYFEQGFRWEQAERYWLKAYLQKIQSPMLQPLTVLQFSAHDLFARHWSFNGKRTPGLKSSDPEVYLPGRNLMMLAKAGTFCALHGIGKIALEPKATALPLDVHFGQDLRLVNYKLNHLSIARGDSLTLTLAWQGLRTLPQNYTVSVQIINRNWQKAGQVDDAPTPPMTTWKVAQPNELPYTVQIDSKTPPGLYDVRLAVYAKDTDEQIQLLPVQWDARRMPTDNIVLTQVRID